MEYIFPKDMEDLKLVSSKRRCNYINWAYTYPAGFEQHMFGDYYCKTS